MLRTTLSDRSMPTGLRQTVGDELSRLTDTVFKWTERSLLFELEMPEALALI